MRILDWKRWQWSLAGIAVALLLAFATGAGNEQAAPLSRMPQSDFEKQLVVPRGFLESLVLHPMPDGYRLTGTLLMPNGTSEHFFLDSKDPFRAQGMLHPPARVNTLKKYLDWVSTRNIGITYRYAWWEGHWWSGLLGEGRWSLYALIGAFVGGVVWPTGLALAQGKPLLDELLFYKRRPATSRGHPPPSKESLEQLDNMISGLEQDLAANGSNASPGSATAGKQEAPVQLEGKPLPAMSQEQPEDADKQFGGEFYPTEVHGQDPPEQRKTF